MTKKSNVPQPTNQEKEFIRKQWEAGTSIKTIIRMLPYKEYYGRCIIKSMRESGELPVRKRASWGKEAEVIEAYLSGITNKYELMDMFDLCDSSIVHILIKNGFGGRPPHDHKKREKIAYNKLSPKTQAIILELKKSTSVAKICRQFKVTRGYVYTVKRKYLNIEINTNE